MVDISILVENTSVSKDLISKHGLSILIKTPDSRILLDTGPDKSFILNAGRLNADLDSVHHLVLSHAHIDHTGGLDAFDKINKTARIYLARDLRERYYFRLKKYIYLPVGIKASRSVVNRITSVNTDTKITEDAWIIKNTSTGGFRPSLNRYLYIKNEGNKLNDNFAHESTLVIVDGKELVLFNSCSHSGVTNIIESVVKVFPGFRVRSFVGGMHLSNPGGKPYEDAASVKEFAAQLSEYDIKYYTGHCTGEVPFGILKQRLGNGLEKISTGMKLTV